MSGVPFGRECGQKLILGDPAVGQQNIGQRGADHAQPRHRLNQDVGRDIALFQKQMAKRPAPDRVAGISLLGHHRLARAIRWPDLGWPDLGAGGTDRQIGIDEPQMRCGR